MYQQMKATRNMSHNALPQPAMHIRTAAKYSTTCPSSFCWTNDNAKHKSKVRSQPMALCRLRLPFVCSMYSEPTLHRAPDLLFSAPLLLAISLKQSPFYFLAWLTDTLPTLRMLHCSPCPARASLTHSPASDTTNTSTFTSSDQSPSQTTLSCTPHAHFGILTLLHQDPTGGLEILNSSSKWSPAPSIPGTIVLNIGDLIAEVSGGRWVATMHGVRSPVGTAEIGGGGTLQ